MPFTVTMPKLSPTMTEGTIARWAKKEGDRVESGDLLLEVATDKATVEHNALDEGFLKKILINEGSEAIVNQPIAIFTEEESESIDGYQPEGAVPSQQESKPAPLNGEELVDAEPVQQKATTASFSQPLFQPEPPLQSYQFPAKGIRSDRIKSSPMARKIALEKNIDLTTVQGTGPGGRVVSRDVENLEKGARVAFDSQQAPKDLPGTYEQLPLSPMRKAIAQRLQESKTFIPHFYTEQDLNAEPMVQLREQLKSQGVKVSYNDMMVRAVALALRDHPGINSGYHTKDAAIVTYKTIDLSIAVSIDGGLITPIVRHADYKSIGQIAKEIRQLADRAKKGELKPEEYKGGSFTVSNLGMYGVSRFSAIINPPQGAILAVGGLREEPVVKDGTVVPGYRMAVCLSADHRVIDGALAAQFLATLRQIIESPAILLL